MSLPHSITVTENLIMRMICAIFRMSTVVYSDLASTVLPYKRLFSAFENEHIIEPGERWSDGRLKKEGG